jgi:hypothetical protein
VATGLQGQSNAPEVELLPLLSVDAALVESWIKIKHVRRWLIDPQGAVSDLRDASRFERQRLIVVDSEPVGFLQWEKVDSKEWAALGVNVSDGAIDIDILIGVEVLCGRGIGSAAIGCLVKELGSSTLVATTSLSNLPCRRAFQKCGFVEKQQFYEPGAGRMVLMVLAPRGT